jgi:spermidine synthase
LCRNHLKYCEENVYNDDRVLLSYEDANNYFNSTLDKFDIVICDLPDPWINIGDGLYSNQFWNSIKVYTTREF